MSIPAFTSNIPLVGQSLGFTQQLVNNNFGNYNGLIGVDHYAPNTGNQGKHMKVTMPIQATKPTTLSNEVCCYGFADPNTSLPQIFVRSNAVNVSYQLTGTVISGEGDNDNGGTTMLFGGFIFLFGNFDVTSGSQAVLFATQSGQAFPNGIYNIVCTASPGGASKPSFAVANVTKTGFTFNTSSVGGTAYYQAIGF
jgi:hypothetical protein